MYYTTGNMSTDQNDIKIDHFWDLNSNTKKEIRRSVILEKN